MRHIGIQLTVLSPLAIRADHAPGGAATARYIAGSTLMGSLAALYRLFYDDRHADFKQLFLSQRVFYPDLFPATFGGKVEKGGIEWWNRVDMPVYPLPLTARTCKRSPGFLEIPPGDTREVGHGACDSLFDWTIFKLASEGRPVPLAGALRLLEAQQKCSECGKSTKVFLEHYRRNESISNRPIMAAHASTRVQTHTGISRETGTVQEGILYSREVFKEQTRFWGLLKVPDELAGSLKDFLAQVGNSGLLRVGAGRSRGLGKVRLDAELLNENSYSYPAFKERLETFHRAFISRAGTVLDA